MQSAGMLADGDPCRNPVEFGRVAEARPGAPTRNRSPPCQFDCKPACFANETPARSAGALQSAKERGPAGGLPAKRLCIRYTHFRSHEGPEPHRTALLVDEPDARAPRRGTATYGVEECSEPRHHHVSRVERMASTSSTQGKGAKSCSPRVAEKKEGALSAQRVVRGRCA